MSSLKLSTHMELRKAFGRNPWFWIALAFGVFLAVWTAIVRSELFFSTLEMAIVDWQRKEVGYSTVGAYALWMPLDNMDLPSGIFFMVWPILAAIPYAWAWTAETRSGLIEQECVRAGRRATVVSKWVAVFLTGFAIIAVPYAVNLLCNLCVEPAMSAWISDGLYARVLEQTPFSSLFYNNPLAFCILWTFVAGALGGLWATVVAALSMVVGSYLPSLVVSYLSLHVLAFIGDQITMYTHAYAQYSYAAMLSLEVLPTVSVRVSTGSRPALVATVLALAVLSIVPPVALRKRDLL